MSPSEHQEETQESKVSPIPPAQAIRVLNHDRELSLGLYESRSAIEDWMDGIVEGAGADGDGHNVAADEAIEDWMNGIEDRVGADDGHVVAADFWKVLDGEGEREKKKDKGKGKGKDKGEDKDKNEDKSASSARYFDSADNDGGSSMSRHGHEHGHGRDDPSAGTHAHNEMSYIEMLEEASEEMEALQDQCFDADVDAGVDTDIDANFDAEADADAELELKRELDLRREEAYLDYIFDLDNNIQSLSSTSTAVPGRDGFGYFTSPPDSNSELEPEADSDSCGGGAPLLPSPLSSVGDDLDEAGGAHLWGEDDDDDDTVCDDDRTIRGYEGGNGNGNDVMRDEALPDYFGDYASTTVSSPIDLWDSPPTPPWFRSPLQLLQDEIDALIGFQSPNGVLSPPRAVAGTSISLINPPGPVSSGAEMLCGMAEALPSPAVSWDYRDMQLYDDFLENDLDEGDNADIAAAAAAAAVLSPPSRSSASSEASFYSFISSHSDSDSDDSSAFVSCPNSEVDEATTNAAAAAAASHELQGILAQAETETGTGIETEAQTPSQEWTSTSCIRHGYVFCGPLISPATIERLPSTFPRQRGEPAVPVSPVSPVVSGSGDVGNSNVAQNEMGAQEEKDEEEEEENGMVVVYADPPGGIVRPIPLRPWRGGF
ncbi:hypothetical protein F4808DRAFT_469729 [Astrocystis sublimbata]|nr:hypothetical protein F4808DRAFT_469729 [Astrocystis sublimbata]